MLGYVRDLFYGAQPTTVPEPPSRPDPPPEPELPTCPVSVRRQQGVAKVHYVNCKDGPVMGEYDYDEIIERLHDPKEGDIVEDVSVSGYRTAGVYLIYRSNDGRLYLDNLDWKMGCNGDEGHVGRGLSLGPDFPVGYWRRGMRHLRGAYLHNMCKFEPLDKSIWQNIRISDLVSDGGDVSKRTYKWGILYFPGSPQFVADRLKFMKYTSEQVGTPGQLYFDDGFITFGFFYDFLEQLENDTWSVSGRSEKANHILETAKEIWNDPEKLREWSKQYERIKKRRRSKSKSKKKKKKGKSKSSHK